MNLNLRSNDLYCYVERQQPSIQKLVSIMLGIIAGDSLPAVDLFLFPHGYELPYVAEYQTFWDGGRHRAKGFYLLRTQMPYNLIDHVDGIKGPTPEQVRTHIKDMVFVSDPNELIGCAKYDSNYRPLDDPASIDRDVLNALGMNTDDYASLIYTPWEKALNLI